MFEQLEKDPGKRLRVTLLSAEWRASSNEDLTVINRELAIQMAKHPNVEVSVFVPQCSEEDKKRADSNYRVKLIEAVKMPGYDQPVDWLASVPDGHAMDCVIGHGVVLGRQIQLIKRNQKYSHCKWIQVVHSAPEEIGMYKNISKGQQMQKTELELCEMADQVVTIGPKLTDVYKHQLKKKDIFNLTPGIFTEFSDVQQASDERKTFCVLVKESGDSEDFDAKGYEIPAKAISNLHDKSYQLRFASKQRGKEDEIAEKLRQCGIGRNQLIVRSFDEDRETLVNLFCEVDIAILPSRSEGFGLSALEAISAGLPVLVSENSGIAQALREVPNGSQCIVDSEDPAKWASAIKSVRDKTRNVRLTEAKILCDNYFKVYSWKKSIGDLVEKMYNLAFGGSGDTRNKKCTLPTPSDLYTVRKGKSKVSEQSPYTVPGPGGSEDIRNKKCTAPNPSDLCTVRKGKSQVSEKASDPVPGLGSVELIAQLQQMQTDASKVSDKTDLKTDLKKIASGKGFRIVDNERSGNCMFYALSDQLEIAMSIKIEHNELRQRLVQYLRENPKLPNGTNLFHFVHGYQSWDDYLTYMEQDGAWGDHVILCAAANYYKTCIRVVSSLSTATDVILQPQCPVDTTRTLVLGHIHEVHYVSLHSTQGSTRNQKHKAPHSSSLYTVKKEKRQVSKQALDPVLQSVAWLETCDSALSTLQRETKTQSTPLLAAETFNKKGVPVESKGWNALHSAAESGNEGMIEKLLSSGFDIDSKGNDGTTPLMVAAAAGKEETVNLLLSKGADPHLKNYIGRNLLHAAAEGGNTSIVERLLSCGIDIDSQDDEYSVTPLVIAARGNHVEVMENLLKKGANLSVTTASNNSNILHIASQYGSVAAIEMLLSHGLGLDSRDGGGNMPLVYAAACGQIEAVNCLLKHGADPLLKGNDGWSLLHFAAQSGNVIIIDIMLSEGLGIDSRSETLGLTPLFVSLMYGKLEAAKHLLEKGANKSVETNFKVNALTFAAYSGSVAAIALLLSHGLSIDFRDGDGNTPLLAAAQFGNTEALIYLLARGADPLLENDKGLGLLHNAARSNNVATIEAVLSKSFDVNVRASSLGITPLFFSLLEGNLEAANYLLERGADEHLKIGEGLTLLSAAARSGNVAVIEMLLNRGHNPNSRDGYDKTPLMWAVESGNQAAVEYLLPLSH